MKLVDFKNRPYDMRRSSPVASALNKAVSATKRVDSTVAIATGEELSELSSDLNHALAAFDVAV